MDDKVFQRSFFGLMTVIGKMYTKEQLKVYKALLDDIDETIFSKAVEDICKSQKEFYPQTNIVALIRARCAEITTQYLLPEEAWEDFEKCCANPHYKNNGKGLDETIKRTLKMMGGFDQVRYLKLDDPSKEPFLRAQFIKYYTSFKTRGDQEKIAPLEIGEDLSKLIKGIGGDDGT